MNWKDLLLNFLVILVAIIAYDKGVKPLLEPKKGNKDTAEKTA